MKAIYKRELNSVGPHKLKPMEYCHWHGVWYAHCPGPDDLVANLASHTVTYDEINGLTVTPSILCADGKGGHAWHGYITNDRWIECP